ncbi:hypothetical protein ATANTOWER_021658, partial [Ataeniobius toweri]|nr:hypothetical protein [Ataeniobius toweri]
CLPSPPLALPLSSGKTLKLLSPLHRRVSPHAGPPEDRDTVTQHDNEENKPAFMLKIIHNLIILLHPPVPLLPLAMPNLPLPRLPHCFTRRRGHDDELQDGGRSGY